MSVSEHLNKIRLSIHARRERETAEVAQNRANARYRLSNAPRIDNKTNLSALQSASLLARRGLI